MEAFNETKAVRHVCGAYVITHVKSGKVYVGSSINLGYRLSAHLRFMKTGVHIVRELAELYKDDPQVQIIYFKTKTREEAYDKEQELLNECFLLTPDKVLNTARDARKPQLGIPISEEHREKLRLARTGTKASAEMRLKMSISQTGRVHSAESIEKVRQAHLGLKHSNETKLLMRKNRKDVRKIQIDDVIYPSTMEAARQLSVSQPTIWWRANSSNFPNWKFV